MNLYHIRTTCRLCESNDLSLSIPLQPIPLVSPNIGNSDKINEDLLRKTAPVDVFQCNNCGLLQLTTVLDAHFQYDTFMYETSVSLGLKEHFEEFAETLHQMRHKEQYSVFEIGSNDGTLLAFFQKKGANVLGVDPAKKIAAAATQKGIPTYGDFFNKTLANEIINDYGKMDYILCNNTLANIDDLADITDGVATLLDQNGLFVFETQYALDVFEKNLLDVIYHEHLTYFSVKPLIKFFSNKGFEVVKVERIWPKGGSIRVYVQLVNGGKQIDPSVKKLFELEEESGLYNQALTEKFNQSISDVTSSLHKLINEANYFA